MVPNKILIPLVKILNMLRDCNHLKNLIIFIHSYSIHSHFQLLRIGIIFLNWYFLLIRIVLNGQDPLSDAKIFSKFSRVWNEFITSLRSEDLISNKLSLLHCRCFCLLHYPALIFFSMWTSGREICCWCRLLHRSLFSSGHHSFLRARCALFVDHTYLFIENCKCCDSSKVHLFLLSTDSCCSGYGQGY